MPVRPFKPLRRSKSTRRLKRVRRQLFPSSQVGEGYNQTLNTKVGQKKPTKTFGQKLANVEFPAYYVEHMKRGGLNTSSMYPMDYGTGTTGKLGFDGLQHVLQVNMQSVDDVVSYGVRKLRDVYTVPQFTNGTAGASPSIIPDSDDVSNWSKSGIKIKQHYVSFNQTFTNMSNTTAEFEVIMLTPNRLISNNDQTAGSVFTDPWQWWIKCNSNAEIAANLQDPALTDDPLVTGTTNLAVNPYTIGDRPYKKKDFKKWWRVVDKKTFKLTPGVSQKYNYINYMNKMLDYEDMHRYAAMPGVTYYMLVISKGQVVNGTNSTTAADISTSDVAYGYVTKRVQKFQAMKFRRTIRISNAQSFATAFDLGAGQQNFINPDTNASTVWSGLTTGV